MFADGKITLFQIGEYFLNLIKRRMKKKKKSKKLRYNAPIGSLSKIEDNTF